MRSIFTEAAGRMEKRVYFITSEQLRVVVLIRPEHNHNQEESRYTDSGADGTERIETLSPEALRTQ